MSDDELLILAQDDSALTDAAKQALAGEIAARRLTPLPEKPPVAPEPEPSPDSPYAQDRELVDICTVWSLPDALQVQALLDRAGIPFFMGTEKATRVAEVTSNFSEGVSVQIMRVALSWIRQAMQDYAPRDEPPQYQQPEWQNVTVTCPKCGSTEVIFERLMPETEPSTEGSTSKYEWECDSCGHHWEDEGVIGG
jgi:DNA-directed RNA polymerase subunit M/transcription elongation factor TFIIS